MIYPLITFLCIIKLAFTCKDINGCILCNQYASCIKCDSFHRLQNDVCIYNPYTSQNKKNTQLINNNHNKINNGQQIYNNRRSFSPYSITYNAGGHNSIGLSLAFSGIGSKNQAQLDNCGYAYKQICMFCVQGYKLEEGKCIQNFKRCLRFDQNYRCIQCSNELVMGSRNVCVDKNCDIGNTYRCIKCKNGFKNNRHGVCYDQNCMTVRNGGCIRCQNGYFLNLAGICTQYYTRKSINNNLKNQPNNIVLPYNNNNKINKTQQVTQKIIRSSTNNININYPQYNPNRAQINTHQSLTIINGNINSNNNINKIYSKTQQQTIDKKSDSTNNIRSSSSITDKYCNRTQNGICKQCKYDLILMNKYCMDDKCKFTSLAGYCRQCRQGYKLNVNISICQELQIKIQKQQRIQLIKKQQIIKKQQKPNRCKRQVNNKCKQCIDQYRLYNDQCVLRNMSYYRYCLEVQQTVCNQCSNGYFINKYGNCTKIVQNCLQYDSKYCIQCQNNYKLGNRLCKRQDPQCIVKDLRHNCITCKTLYIPKNGYCQPVNPLCKQYNRNNGLCTQCYQAYKLQNGQCISDYIIPNNNNHHNFNNNNNNNYDNNNKNNNNKNNNNNNNKNNNNNNNNYNNNSYIKSNNSNNYNTYNINSNNNNNNNKSNINNNYSKNINNNNYNNNNNNINRINYNNNNKNNYNYNNNYNSNNNNNYKTETVTKAPQNCIQYNNNICSKCMDRYIVYNNICKQVSKLCDQYHKVHGYCLSCKQGYNFMNGLCLPNYSKNNDNIQSRNKQEVVIQKPQLSNNNYVQKQQKSQTQQQTDNYRSSRISQDYCKHIDYQNKKCLSCYNSFYLNNGQCVRINPLCKSYNQTNGYCLSCYEGFILNNITCTFLGIKSNQHIQNCVISNQQNNICIQCRDRYYLSNNKCKQVLPQCQQYNRDSGLCTSCYDGYFLAQGRCIFSRSFRSIPYCKQYNLSFQCSSCVSGYFKTNENRCNPVSVLCDKYNPNNGNCMSCISGYFLYGTQCIQPALGQDRNCIRYDDGGYCLKCRQNFIIKDFFCTHQ